MKQGKLDRHLTDENNRLRDLISETLTNDCTITRKTRTQNGIGGFTESWNPIAGSPTRCALNAMNSKGEAVIADQIKAKTLYVLHLPPNTDIRHSDRVTIGSRTFEVESVLNPVSIEVARTCHITWIEGS